MAIPTLTYNPQSQNQRVTNFEVPGDEYPRIYTTENLLSAADFDMLIMAAYRQIYHEQQMLSSNRQTFLESQLRSHQITVKDFISGLLLSDSFRRLTFDSNNNYRFVELCIQRVLGRQVYNDRETMAWSILLATTGLQGFVKALINSEEYLENFGDSIVPYQRRRILPQRASGEITFAHTARYGTDYRDKLPQPNMSALHGPGFTGPMMSPNRWAWQNNPPKVIGQIGAAITYSGVALIGFLIIALMLGL